MTMFSAWAVLTARIGSWRAASLLLLACLVVANNNNNNTKPINLSPSMFLSSKTPYFPQQHYTTYEAMPSHCKLVHINHLGRHGSRHSTKLKASLHLYDALAEALRLGKLKPRGVVLLQWIARFAEHERDQLGEFVRTVNACVVLVFTSRSLQECSRRTGGESTKKRHIGNGRISALIYCARSVKADVLYSRRLTRVVRTEAEMRSSEAFPTPRVLR